MGFGKSCAGSECPGFSIGGPAKIAPVRPVLAVILSEAEGICFLGVLSQGWEKNKCTTYSEEQREKALINHPSISPLDSPVHTHFSPAVYP